MGVRIKGGTGWASFTKTPKMLPFLGHGSSWPSPQSHLSEGRGRLYGFLYSGAEIQVKSQLILRLYLPVTKLASLLSPQQ